jgi:hypothetical protein
MVEILASFYYVEEPATIAATGRWRYGSGSVLSVSSTHWRYSSNTRLMTRPRGWRSTCNAGSRSDGGVRHYRPPLSHVRASSYQCMMIMVITYVHYHKKRVILESTTNIRARQRMRSECIYGCSPCRGPDDHGYCYMKARDASENLDKESEPWETWSIDLKCASFLSSRA